MEKILKFLKCNDIEDVYKKIKSYEISEELQEFKNLMIAVSEKQIIGKDITNKKDLIEYLKKDMGFNNLEEFKVLFLDSSNKIIANKTLFKGTVNRNVVYPRVVIEEALKYSTRGLILVHNHPTGLLNPSSKDIELTDVLYDLCENLDIKLIDHIIVSNNNYFSFFENNLIVC